MFNLRSFCVMLLLYMTFVIPARVCAQASHVNLKRPNIIYILLDDVGFSDLQPYGSEIPTPNIDQLAKEGIRYNHFDTRAICSPSRASLLTGRNNQTVGMMDLASQPGHYGNGKQPSYNLGYIIPAAATISQILKINGYRTSMVGKWHLTPKSQISGSTSDKENWPMGKGFDNFYGWLGGWTDQFNPIGAGREIIENGRPVTTPHPRGYDVEVAITDHAIQYLEKGFEDHPGQPQFLFYSMGAAHAPLQVPERYIQKFAGVYDEGWDRLREKRYEQQKKLGIIPENAVLTQRNPGNTPWDSLTPVQKTVFAQFMATYAGYITQADEQIGRLIHFLKDAGEYDNTIIFLMSDNGAAPEAGEDGNFYNPYVDTTTVQEMLDHINELGTEQTQALYQRPWAMLGNTPFKRYKLWPNLGGVRDPLIISWPEKIRDHGAIRSQHVGIIDITPTVLDIVGIKAPKVVDGVKQIDMAGKSIQNTFDDPDAQTRDIQFFSLRGGRAIRKGGWRAVAHHKKGTDFSKDQWQLYHLADDYSGSVDLSKKYVDKLNALKKLWWEQAKKYGALPLEERK
ncbi:MAG TPA: arylsulfatase [Hanamia sp.]|nr:arylsulfatase [Hanamia sp.]